MATLLLVASRNGSAGDAIADFFRKPLAAQEKEFSRYDFDDQFRIYLAGQRREPPYVHLADSLAREGSAVAEPLRLKLVNATDDLTIRDILAVFREMTTLQTHEVKKDKQVMDALRGTVLRIQDPYWKGMCEQWVRQIQRA
jgi:hypothetical protein